MQDFNIRNAKILGDFHSFFSFHGIKTWINHALMFQAGTKAINLVDHIILADLLSTAIIRKE